MVKGKGNLHLQNNTKCSVNLDTKSKQKKRQDQKSIFCKTFFAPRVTALILLK